MIRSEDMVVEVEGHKNQIAVDLLIVLHSFFARNIFNKKEIEDILESDEKLIENKNATKEDVDVINELLRKLEGNN